MADLLIDADALRSRIGKAIEHTQIEMKAVQTILDKDKLEVEELVQIARLLNQLESSPSDMATYDCVG